MAWKKPCINLVEILLDFSRFDIFLKKISKSLLRTTRMVKNIKILHPRQVQVVIKYT